MKINNTGCQYLLVMLHLLRKGDAAMNLQISTYKGRKHLFIVRRYRNPKTKKFST